MQIKGWFDRSDELPITVPIGRLVEIETQQTNMALIAMGGTTAIAFFLMFLFGLPAWGLTMFFGVVAASCMAAFVLGRIRPTMQLRLKH